MKKLAKQRYKTLHLMVVVICFTILPINGHHPDSKTLNSARRTMAFCCKEDLGYWNVNKNATGHILTKEGIFVEMLDWLTIEMQFEYECLPEKNSERFVKDNVTNKPTWNSLHRLKAGFCSMAPGPYVLDHERFKDFDFLHTMLFRPNTMLIPEPSLSLGGMSSVWRPFQTMIWTVLVISLVFTMAMSVFEWFLEGRNEQRGRIELHWLFLFGLLVSKAGFRAPRKFKMRLVGGAWCLAALVLTNYYSTSLTVLITSAKPQPLVNSVEELADKDNVGLAVLKGYGVASTISNRETSISKKLDDKIKNNPNSLICSESIQCVAHVAQTGESVFINPDRNSKSNLVEYLQNNKTNHCNVTFAKGKFGISLATWAISKNNSDFETFQRGILRMMEAGLFKQWEGRFLPNPKKCSLGPFEHKEKWASVRRPDLVNLASLFSAFTYLFLGFSLAFLALLIECIVLKIFAW